MKRFRQSSGNLLLVHYLLFHNYHNFDYLQLLLLHFHYLVLEEKTIDDYPVVNLKKDEFGAAKITCNKGNEKIVYTFKMDELSEIEHTITENDINKNTKTSLYEVKESIFVKIKKWFKNLFKQNQYDKQI